MICMQAMIHQAGEQGMRTGKQAGIGHTDEKPSLMNHFHCMLRCRAFMHVIDCLDAGYPVTYCSTWHLLAADVLYRQFRPGVQTQWCSLLLHLGYSSLAFLTAACLTLTHPQSWDLHWRPLHEGRVHVCALADALVCISAGFFAFQLWTLVHER